MNAILMTAALLTGPMPVSTTDLETLFDGQQQEIIEELRNDARAELRERSARYFAVDGELRQLMAKSTMEAGLAAR